MPEWVAEQTTSIAKPLQRVPATRGPYLVRASPHAPGLTALPPCPTGQPNPIRAPTASRPRPRSETPPTGCFLYPIALPPCNASRRLLRDASSQSAGRPKPLPQLQSGPQSWQPRKETVWHDPRHGGSPGGLTPRSRFSGPLRGWARARLDSARRPLHHQLSARHVRLDCPVQSGRYEPSHPRASSA